MTETESNPILLLRVSDKERNILNTGSIESQQFLKKFYELPYLPLLPCKVITILS